LALTAGLLQGLTVLQQCVYQVKFKTVCKVKKWLVQPALVWSRTLSILLSSEHFKQFYCRQLKNRQLDEMSAKVPEMGTKCAFTRYVN